MPQLDVAHMLLTHVDDWEAVIHERPDCGVAHELDRQSMSCFPILDH